MIISLWARNAKKKLHSLQIRKQTEIQNMSKIYL